jgi:hypothetical protein
MLLGMLLVFIANRGEVNAWEPVDIFLTLGLVGYVLIISAIAWFLLTLLNKHLDDIV